MNTNMMELNMNEMERVNGGFTPDEGKGDLMTKTAGGWGGVVTGDDDSIVRPPLPAGTVPVVVLGGLTGLWGIA